MTPWIIALFILLKLVGVLALTEILCRVFLGYSALDQFCQCITDKRAEKRRAKERQIEHEKLKDPLKYYMTTEEFERKLRGE